MLKQLKDFKISDRYYILAVLSYASTLFAGWMRPGVFGALLMVLVLCRIVLKRDIRISALQDCIAVAFFAYQVISVIWLLRGGYPLSVYVNEFVSSCFPMIFYFVGKSSDDRAVWYVNYLYAMMFLGLLGLIMYIWAPQFYCDWAYKWSYISKADAATMRVRMHSVVGSTCLSFLMVSGMLAGAYFLGNGVTNITGSNEKPRQHRNIVFAVVTICLCLLFAILANQRSGLVAAALVLVYINYLIFFRLDMIPKKFFLYEIAAVIVIFFAVAALKFDFILKFWYRIISLPTAISQRSEQWVAAVNNMYSSWIGNGLGANGHRSIGVEDAHVIADGGIVKLYCENGVIGFSLFVYLLVLSLSDGIRNIRRYYVEVGIIIVGLLQSIGSNMLAFQICAPVFWYAVGTITQNHPDR